jgi:bacterioferritin-associated ferredoxin
MSIVQDLCPALTDDEIERIARESEFCKRVKKKYPHPTICSLCAKNP